MPRVAVHPRHGLVLGGLGGLVLGGAASGLIGGAAMALLALLLVSTAGESAWRPIEAVASFFLGSRAMTAPVSAGTIAVGLLLHAVAAAVLGVIFATLFAEFPTEVLIPVGILYGLAVWLLVRFVVIPTTDLALAGPPAALIAEHVVFGACLWLFLPIRQAIERRS